MRGARCGSRSVRELTERGLVNGARGIDEWPQCLRSIADADSTPRGEAQDRYDDSYATDLHGSIVPRTSTKGCKASAASTPTPTLMRITGG